MKTHKIEKNIGQYESEKELFVFLLKQKKHIKEDEKWRLFIAKCYNKYTNKKLSELEKDCLANHQNASAYYNKVPTDRTIRNYISHVPPTNKRNEMILICVLCGMTKNGVNYCLTRFGRQNSLYVRSVDDCIWDYIISNRDKFNKNDLLTVFNKEKIKLNKFINNIDPNKVDEKICMDTVRVEKKLESNALEFDEIVDEELILSFINTHKKLIESIKKAFYADMNTKEYVKVFSFHSDGSGSYKKLNNARNAVYSGVVPKRNELIALGLHLRLNKDGVNHILLSAGMEKLMPKNTMEAIVIFCMEQLELQYPCAFNKISSSPFDLDDNMHSISFRELNHTFLWKYIEKGKGKYNKVIEDDNIGALLIRGMLLVVNEKLYKSTNEDISIMISLL